MTTATMPAASTEPWEPPDTSDFEPDPEMLETPAPAPASIPPPTRRRPGPAPDPNSQRSRRKAAKAAKATKAPPPRRRAAPNKTAAAPSPDTMSPREAGALTILGWVARPLAMAGMGMIFAATTAPEGSPRARQLAEQGQALSLDAVTLSIHGPALAQGIADVADHLPWMAAALEKAAKISPFAAVLEASSAIVLQVMANHGLIPVSPTLGTLSPDEIRAAAGLADDE